MRTFIKFRCLTNVYFPSFLSVKMLWCHFKIRRRRRWVREYQTFLVQTCSWRRAKRLRYSYYLYLPSRVNCINFNERHQKSNRQSLYSFSEIVVMSFTSVRPNSFRTSSVTRYFCAISFRWPE